MINRKRTYRISFASVSRENKVTAIKLLRRLTDMGLKEAKETVEETMGCFSHVDSHLEGPLKETTLVDLLDEAKATEHSPRTTPGDLRLLGAVVIMMPNGATVASLETITHLRKALCSAANSYDFALIRDIVSLLEKHDASI